MLEEVSTEVLDTVPVGDNGPDPDRLSSRNDRPVVDESVFMTANTI